MATRNPLEMSDEEILAMNSAPPVEETPPAEPVEAPAEAPPATEGTTEDDNGTDTGSDSGNSGGDPSDPAGDEPLEEGKPEPEPAAVPEPAGEPERAAVPDSAEPPEGVTDPKPSVPEVPAGWALPEPEQAQTVLKDMMAPLKANGKTIELRNPEELRQLAQMGANYTKKLQQLQPHRKVLMMLENNGLLDEGKLSFLIDVDKRDPEAIKKLLKDGGIDPLDIDTTSDPAYLGGNHQVSDEEANFRTTLDELSSNPKGAETLAEINTGWDQASKEVLWGSPEIMSVIHEQREMGIYDTIKAEVDRQKTLGQIPPNTPFLQAYKTVGDAMAQAALGTTGGNGGQQTGRSVPGQAQPQVLATRVAAPKSTVTNGDRASAASPTRASAPVKAPTVNPLAMSDDDFLKQMENRL